MTGGGVGARRIATSIGRRPAEGVPKPSRRGTSDRVISGNGRQGMTRVPTTVFSRSILLRCRTMASP